MSGSEVFSIVMCALVAYCLWLQVAAVDQAMRDSQADRERRELEKQRRARIEA